MLRKLDLSMRSTGVTVWQDGEMWLGYLDEYLDNLTQGTSREDLKKHLLDLCGDHSPGAVPMGRKLVGR